MGACPDSSNATYHDTPVHRVDAGEYVQGHSKANAKLIKDLISTFMVPFRKQRRDDEPLICQHCIT